MFRLLRYFSMASLLSIAIAAVLLGALYRHVALGNLSSMGEGKNVALAHALSNAMRAETEALLSPADDDTDPSLRAARLASLAQSVLEYTRELSVVKVKLYGRDGITVFSSDPTQIGEDKSANAGFQSAVRGRAASELTRRDQFSAFEGTITNRDLLSSYVPMWRTDRREVQAVFEIYEDLTPLLAELSDTQRRVMAGVALVLLGLYAILFLIVRHADRIMQRQHLEGLEQTRQLEAGIAEREKTHASLVEARLVAEEANKSKSQFLAIMSHEIRTPMHGVLGMTELLLDAGLEDTQRRYVQTIRSSADSLLRIINDILDFSKIEAGRLELDPGEVDLAAMVGEAVELMAPSASQKQLVLDCVIAPGVPSLVRVDRVRLMQVLLNLLGNAIKFTSAGSVKLAVSHGDAPEGGLPVGYCLLRFSVTDSGIGISEEAQERLFRTFTQADGSITRRFGGTGLGLAVSKQLCEMMGGSIGLHSAPDRGSTFWFTICIEAIDRTSALAVAPSARDRPVAGLAETIPRRPESGPRVLLAEDSPVIAEIAQAILETAGCRVTSAVNGRLAVDAWRREPFDLVLMDCQMPECDGFDATREIRSLEAGSAAHVPIVALTASTMDGDRDRCMAAGMDDYLTKPFNRSELHALLARWVVPADAAATGGVPPSGRSAAG